MPNTPMVNLGELYVTGLLLTHVDDENITIGIGQCRDSTNVNDIEVEAALTVSNVLSGAGGLDTGSVAASTWYAVYVIGSSVGDADVAGLLSTSSTAPNLPANYDMKRLIGYVKTDGSSDFLAFSAVGNGKDKRYYWEANINITAATKTGGSMVTTLTAASLAAGMPPIRGVALLDVTYTPATLTNVLSFSPHETAATSVGIVRYGTGVGGAQVGMVEVLATLNSGAPSIKFQSSHANDALTTDVAGWVHSIA